MAPSLRADGVGGLAAELLRSLIFSELLMYGVLGSSMEDLHPFSFQHFLGFLPRPDKRMMCP
jgi:hypothetical protein